MDEMVRCPHTFGMLTAKSVVPTFLINQVNKIAIVSKQVAEQCEMHYSGTFKKKKKKDYKGQNSIHIIICLNTF